MKINLFLILILLGGPAQARLLPPRAEEDVKWGLKAHATAHSLRHINHFNRLPASLLDEPDQASGDQPAGPPHPKKLDNRPISLGDYSQFLSAVTEVQRWPYILESYTTAFTLERLLNFRQVETERVAVFQRLAETLPDLSRSLWVAQSLSYESREISLSEYYHTIHGLLKSRQISLTAYPAFEIYMQYLFLSDAVNIDTLFDTEPLAPHFGRRDRGFEESPR